MEIGEFEGLSEEREREEERMREREPAKILKKTGSELGRGSRK